MNTDRNPVGWFEIYVNDMPRAKSFYEATFAITLDLLPTPDASVEMWAFPFDMETDRPGAPGAICKQDGYSPGAGGTLIYFSCDDCSIEAARAEKAGGTIIQPKLSIGDYGFISILSDTEGNTIGLHSMA